MLLIAVLLAACSLPVQGAQAAFRLEVNAPAKAQPGDVIDVVITIKDIKMELVSLEFNLIFDKTKVSGVITETGKPMDELMTVTPTYIMEVAGMQLELSRYEQICTYDSSKGMYVCRFMDLLSYPGAKPGATYKGLIRDGDLVITIPFQVLDTVKNGDQLTFQMEADSVRSTTKAELKGVEGTAGSASITVSDPRGLTVSGSITCGGEKGQTVVELWRKGSEQPSYTATTQEKKYAITNVADGYYTLIAAKPGHVTRSYAVIAEGKNVTRDITLCLLGDVTGDGQVNGKDAVQVYGYLRGSAKITDEYAQACANVTGERITIADVAAIYAHSKGTVPLF